MGQGRVSAIRGVREAHELLSPWLVEAKLPTIGKLKNEGVEYEDRMLQLEEVEWPKPGKDFIYDTFNAFVAGRPWMAEGNVRPKSIAREMFENWQSFEDYVKTYGLERSEAVLLRHLSEVYKVLSQTVPPSAKTPEVLEVETFLEDILRSVDSSLLDEWEKLRNPEYVPVADRPPTERQAQPFTRNKPTFTRALRNAVFDVVKALSHGKFEDLLERIEPQGQMDGHEGGPCHHHHHPEDACPVLDERLPDSPAPAPGCWRRRQGRGKRSPWGVPWGLG
jgi:hypothetical protein